MRTRSSNGLFYHKAIVFDLHKSRLEAFGSTSPF